MTVSLLTRLVVSHDLCSSCSNGPIALMAKDVAAGLVYRQGRRRLDIGRSEKDEGAEIEIIDRHGDGLGPSTGTTAARRWARAVIVKPGLYLVATPIGHLGDLSPRALATLAEADLLICEDTRVTGKLLKINGVERSMHAYHEHNAARMRPRILRHLAEGESVALASDAGTPLVSDPGYKLVRDVIEAGHEVYAVPGPSAALAALVVSGLPTDRFLVGGFLPSKSVARKRTILELATVPASLIWFEAPQRLAASLQDLASCLGSRPAAVARELTKHFEEVTRGTLDELAEFYAGAAQPRGEIAIVVGPPLATEAVLSDEEVEGALATALRTMSPSSAAATVAATTGRSKRELYKKAISLRSPTS